jgi:enamine deaminase RidA (YjgF/YER057c/UK114 family)
MKTKPEAPAFAQAHIHSNDDNCGLTKREYFSAMAMQGLVPDTVRLGNTYQEQADHALQMADALIEELNKDEK